MKRSNSLKRRFIRDKSSHEIYKTFIDDMLQKGYARKVEIIRWERYGIYHIMERQSQLSQERGESSSTVVQNLAENHSANIYCRMRFNKSAGWCIDQVQRETHCIYG